MTFKEELEKILKGMVIDLGGSNADYEINQILSVIKKRIPKKISIGEMRISPNRQFDRGINQAIRDFSKNLGIE